MIWTKKQLEEALSIKLPYITGDSYNNVQFNSQNIEQGDLFIALTGGIRDGHEFVLDALERGARSAIVSSDIADAPKDKLIRVKDTHKALSLLADYKRNSTKAKIIGVTGSVGKTSTKEILKTMLTSYGKTYATSGNFNNSLGVPLTLASMPDDTEYAVIEMGMNHKGELKELSMQARPDIAVLTTVSEAHLEFFNSEEEIADAKCEIFEGLNSKTGIALINRDMHAYERCLENLKKLLHIYSFGKNEKSDFKFSSYEILEDQKTRLVYEIGNENIEIIIEKIFPIHLAENITACFAVISLLELGLDLAISSISQFDAMPGRGKVASVSNGEKNYKIICDYYNANPQSMRASLEYLAQFPEKKKLAVLGDMGELGKTSLDLHKLLVPSIVDSGAESVFLVGKIMSKLEDFFPKNIIVRSYEDVYQLINDIDGYLHGEELLLIKGSKFMNLYKLAKYLGVKNVL